MKFGTPYAQHAVWCELLIAPLNKKYIRREFLLSYQFLRLCSVHSVYVTLKDQKRTLNGKKQPQRVVALEKQLQREIACCECF